MKMKVLDNISFGKCSVARLAEDPGRGDDEWQVLELQRRVETNLLAPNQPAVVVFDLTVFSGNDDLTFSRLSVGDLRKLAAALDQLATAPL